MPLSLYAILDVGSSIGFAVSGLKMIHITRLLLQNYHKGWEAARNPGWGCQRPMWLSGESYVEVVDEVYEASLVMDLEERLRQSIWGEVRAPKANSGTQQG